MFPRDPERGLEEEDAELYDLLIVVLVEDVLLEATELLTRGVLAFTFAPPVQGLVICLDLVATEDFGALTCTVAVDLEIDFAPVLLSAATPFTSASSASSFAFMLLGLDDSENLDFAMGSLFSFSSAAAMSLDGFRLSWWSVLGASFSFSSVGVTSTSW